MRPLIQNTTLPFSQAAVSGTQDQASSRFSAALQTNGTLSPADYDVRPVYEYSAPVTGCAYFHKTQALRGTCLLYTFDPADELAG